MLAREVLHKLTLLLAVALFVSSARAQPFTPTINPSTAPIAINQNPEKLALRSKIADQKLVNIAFGATINGGNTQSYAGNLGGRFGLIRGNNQLQIEAIGTLGGARREGSLTDVDWTTRNALGRARYDRFLSLTDALFIAEVPRRDVQAGLNLRLQTQVGYLRNLFLFNDSHRFWTELGYDFTYDDVNYDNVMPPLTAEMKQMLRDKSPFVHSGRVFFGYTNKLSPTAQVNVGVETLVEPADWKNVRVNGIGELMSSLTQSFKLGLQSRVLFDNEPVTGKKKYDVILLAQLVYTFDSAASATPVTVCPACDCSSQVQAARNQCVKESPLRQFGP